MRILALVLGAAAILTLLAAGPGTRLGLWDWRTGLGLLRYAAYLGIAAAALSAVLLLIPRFRSWTVLVALVLAIGAFAPPLLFQRQARSAPPINDVSASIELKGTDSFAKALAASRAMGWEIVAQDPANGRIEAVATTFWFGFKDDVTVQVRGERVDIRSKSRVGRGDAGTNAQRIRAFRAELLKSA
jgi:hypothetical protein